MAMIGMPGPAEMLILGIVAAVVFGAPVLLLVLLFTKGRPAGPRTGPECPACGGWTVPQANYCPWCGKSLERASHA